MATQQVIGIRVVTHDALQVIRPGAHVDFHLQTKRIAGHLGFFFARKPFIQPESPYT